MEAGQNIGLNHSHTDLAKVTSSYKKECEQKILNREASPEEVLGWYMSHDPVSELLYSRILDSISNESDDLENYDTSKYLAERPHYLFRGGLVVLKELFKSSSGDPNYSEPESVSDYLRELNSLAIPADEEILNLAIVTSHIFSETAEKLITNYRAVDKPINAIDGEILEISSNISVKLFTEIIKTCEKAAASVDFIFVEQAITSTMDFSSACFAAYTSVDEPHRSKHLLYGMSNLVNAIKTYYITNPETKARKGELKGPLHEALWMLDMTFLFATSEDELKNAYVSPSLTRMDQPLIGKPSVNRGFDMACFLAPDPNTGVRTEYFVQLKSSNKHIKEYFPSITLLTETHFKDAQRSYLKSKLDLYDKWIQNSDDPQITAKLTNKTLETARDYLEFLRSAREMTRIEIAAMRLGKTATELTALKPQIAESIERLSY